jgi:hypothetical protein
MTGNGIRDNILDLPSLLCYKRNVFSQSGDDGVIERIFKCIGTTNKLCCEFGAWDGMHLSNTRNLVLNGWEGIFIEADKEKFSELERNYSGYNNVHLINAYIDTSENTLESILKNANLLRKYYQMDFLSIDVDGFDYEIFQSLKILPRLICIEIYSAYHPNSEIQLKGIGKPFATFIKLAARMGYTMICYTGNAFFIRNDIRDQFALPILMNETLYTNALNSASQKDREWLYLMNLGIVDPFQKFNNPLLSKDSLHIRGKMIVAKKLYYEALCKLRNTKYHFFAKH